MTKKKSKFLTFVFSCMPGAGHMYLGFMKLGASLMSIFFILIFFGSWLQIGPILYVSPIVWFYSFFDAMNKNSLTDEEFLLQEDRYAFYLDEKDFKKIKLGKFRVIVALSFIIVGVNLLVSTMLSSFSQLLPNYISSILWSLNDIVPQLFFATIIIAAGLKLIIGKKNELEVNEDL